MRRMLTVSTAAIGCAAALASAGTAAAAATKPGARPFTEVESGTRLSTSDLRYEDVYRVKRSPDGGGSVVRDAILSGTRYPVHGSDVADSYYRTGKVVTAETFTLGTPNVFGVGTVSGRGHCTGGTLVHFGETCTYTFSGSYDLLDGTTHLTLKGTYTLSAKTAR